MNERLKLLRKHLHLSGEKFGKKIGLGKVAISDMENGRYNITEQTILSICREYNVNEIWLRTGKGEMFSELTEFDLSQADPLEQAIIKAYFSIPKEDRDNALKVFKELVDKKVF
jgi:hypothetical protein